MNDNQQRRILFPAGCGKATRQHINEVMARAVARSRGISEDAPTFAA